MHSCVFWCEFIDLVGVLGSYCLTPVTFITEYEVTGAKQ